MEIYNENIRDLLNTSSGNLELRDQDAQGKNIHVAGLSEIATNSTEEVSLTVLMHSLISISKICSCYEICIMYDTLFYM